MLLCKFINSLSPYGILYYLKMLSKHLIIYHEKLYVWMCVRACVWVRLYLYVCVYVGVSVSLVRLTQNDVGNPHVYVILRNRLMRRPLRPCMWSGDVLSWQWGCRSILRQNRIPSAHNQSSRPTPIERSLLLRSLFRLFVTRRICLTK